MKLFDSMLEIYLAKYSEYPASINGCDKIHEAEFKGLIIFLFCKVYEKLDELGGKFRHEKFKLYAEIMKENILKIMRLDFFY